MKFAPFASASTRVFDESSGSRKPPVLGWSIFRAEKTDVSDSSDDHSNFKGANIWILDDNYLVRFDDNYDGRLSGNRRQVRTWTQHQCGETGEKVERFEQHLRGTVSERVFEFMGRSRTSFAVAIPGYDPARGLFQKAH